MSTYIRIRNNLDGLRLIILISGKFSSNQCNYMVPVNGAFVIYVSIKALVSTYKMQNVQSFVTTNLLKFFTRQNQKQYSKKLVY